MDINTCSESTIQTLKNVTKSCLSVCIVNFEFQCDLSLYECYNFKNPTPDLNSLSITKQFATQYICYFSKMTMVKSQLNYFLLAWMFYQKMSNDLTNIFRPMFHFYTPWKRQETKGFLTFSGGVEMKHWPKMG